MRATRVRDFLLVLLIPVVFAAISPWNNLDGVNSPKFLSIATIGSIAFSLSIGQLMKTWSSGGWNLFRLSSGIAILFTLVSLSQNAYSINERIFGVSGRSLGAITFVALFLVLISASLVDLNRLENFLWALVVALGFTLTYFGVQLLGWDFSAWTDIYGSPSSTLGNPNYVSAGMAILSAPIMALVIFKSRFKLFGRLFGIALMTLITYLIWRTFSSQGLVIECLMFIGLLLFRLNEGFKLRYNFLIKSFLALPLALGPILTLAISLGLSIPSSDSSLLSRADYWRASLNLIKDNMFFGKGFDSFGDWYFFYRDEQAVIRNSGIFSNSAHNLFLELGVFGGLPLLMIYFLLQLLALKSALKIATTRGNLNGKILVVSWVGFHLQSIISPSSLAIISLGFLLTGVVYRVGQELEVKSDSRASVTIRESRNLGNTLIFKLGTAILGISITGSGLYLGAIPIVKDARFRDAIEQGDGQRMIEVSRQWPFNYELSRMTAQTLKLNRYDDLALSLVQDLIATNPYNIQGWRLLYEYSSSPAERSRALSKMRELDPLNPEWETLAP